MRELLWGLVAWLVTRPAVRDWLIRRAMRRPYRHIRSADRKTIYMGRWWLFNPYPPKSDGGGDNRGIWGRLPSVRIHHIMRPDVDRDLHDHPWNARTVILKGGYIEERPEDIFNQGDEYRIVSYEPRFEVREVFKRHTGYTGRLLFGEYHQISHVTAGGAWTLFITWRKRGTWGFRVNGKKVPWREYRNAYDAS